MARPKTKNGLVSNDRDTIAVMHGQRHRITCQVESKTYRGTYWVDGQILTVATPKGSKSRQVDSISQEVLAAELLEFLAKEGNAYLDSPSSVRRQL